MIYPGYGVARPVSGPAVLVDLIADRQASNNATIDIAWAGDYAAVFIDLFNVKPITDSVILNMRTSSDGGATFDSGASDYTYRQIGWFASQTSNVGPTSEFRISAGGVGNDATEYNQMSLVLLNPSDTARETQIIGSGGTQGNAGNPASVALYGQRDAAGRVDAIRFLFASGNIDEGRFTVTGLRKE